MTSQFVLSLQPTSWSITPPPRAAQTTELFYLDHIRCERAPRVPPGSRLTQGQVVGQTGSDGRRRADQNSTLSVCPESVSLSIWVRLSRVCLPSTSVGPSQSVCLRLSVHMCQNRSLKKNHTVPTVHPTRHSSWPTCFHHHHILYSDYPETLAATSEPSNTHHSLSSSLLLSILARLPSNVQLYCKSILLIWSAPMSFTWSINKPRLLGRVWWGRFPPTRAPVELTPIGSNTHPHSDLKLHKIPSSSKQGPFLSSQIWIYIY